MAHIEKLTPELYAEVLKLNLRQADIDELTAATGQSPVEVLKASMDGSDYAWVIIHEGAVVGILGITEWEGWGVPWLLASDVIKKFKTTFLRQSVEILAVWLEQYPKLTNCVDSRHTKAIQWLKWLGFTIHEELAVKLHSPDVDFYPFTIYRSNK